MPRGDRTGPMGMGAMSGRGGGFCAGYSVPGFMNAAVPGRNMRWGRGRGGGFGRANSARGVSVNSPDALDQTDELSALESQEKHFLQVLQSIKNRISELEA